jgi:hypothetical protein
MQYVAEGPPCCAAWEARKCPKCGEIDWYNNLEERAKYEERLGELSKQIREYLDLGDLEKACELRGRRWD